MSTTDFVSVADQFIAEGIVRGKAESVLSIIQARFGTVPNEIDTTIRSMIDPPTALESLVAHAATCKSLDEFAQSLK